MRGKNPVTRQRLRGSLRVHEVFDTIQGEGPAAGRPAVFVRLSGCNLRCSFCDTDFSFEQAREVPELVEEVARWGRSLAVLTGGEPLLQGIVPLIRALGERGIESQIETAGTVWVPGLDQTGALVVLSPKTPKVDARVARIASAWKYIVWRGAVSSDGLPSVMDQAGVTTEVPLARPWDYGSSAPIYVQPLDSGDSGENSEARKFAADLAMLHNYRLSVQTHKWVGLP